MLKVTNLHANVNGHEILKGLNLEVRAGEVHAIMGPNGSGKSTLSKVLAGHPSYQITDGTVEFEVNFKQKDLLTMSAADRAREGLFLAFQYPVEVPGVNNSVFLKTALNAICKYQGIPEFSQQAFQTLLREKMKMVEVDERFLERSINEGFSGGEKKKNEILQMAVLNPRLALLDETDSGLDIDALKVVANGVNRLKNQDNAIVLVTHYQRLLDYIEPDYVHVLADGKIIKTGDRSLALELEKRGYDWLVGATGPQQ